MEQMTSRLKSLVVDDDPDYRLLVRIWMEQYGPARYAVVGEAGNGVECLDLVESLEPDLVLLDLTMPGTDPLDVLDEMSTRYPGIRTVVISGFESDLFAADVIAHGAFGYLEKGAIGDEFRRRLDSLLRTA
jgi:DNA-binding NarL/FixJ family response regulator